MECIIPSTNTKVFSKSIQSLTKIGTELYIEGTKDYFSLCTINSTKSAFIIFKFYPSFFTNYTLNNNCDLNKCKVSLKACTGIFKNMKSVEHCKIFFDSNQSKLVVQLKCRLETIKTHLISVIDIETLDASYSKDNIPNKITGSHKLFTEISNNFQINEDEITFDAKQNNFIAKNFIDGSVIDRKFMRSQLTLKTEEFHEYSIKDETSITFCLREFRALLTFAESINLQLTVLFETAGRPAVFILKNLQTFEVNLVMSTLAPDDVSMYQGNKNNSFCSATSSNTSQLKRKNTPNHHDETNVTTSKRARLKSTDFPSPTSSSSSSTLINDNNELFNFKSKTTITTNPTIINEEGDANENEENGENSEIQLSSAINSVPQIMDNIEQRQHQLLSFNENIREFNENRDSDGICVTFKDTEENLINDKTQDYVIPLSPEQQTKNLTDKKKRKRIIFRRCFEATFNPKEKSKSCQEILAENSDSE